MRWQVVLVSVLSLLTSACSSVDKPLTRADIYRYTGLQLCSRAVIKDVTTKEEVNTVPGFSVHVILSMPGSCKPDFEKQLNRLADGGCVPENSRFSCAVLDASGRGKTTVHTTIMAGATSSGDYDFRFYE